MSKKTRTTISIDKEIWDLLKLKLPCSRSQFFENKAREYIFTSASIEELRKEISQMQVELNSKKAYLKEQEKLQKVNDNNINLINNALVTVRKIHSNQKEIIGLNQIYNVARINGLSPEKLEKEIKKDKTINLTKLYEPPEN